MNQSTDILSKHDLRKTPIRIQVLDFFLSKDEAISHAQLEKEMKDSDRVTLYRTLKTFEETGIIHKAIDGTDVARYAICHNECGHHHHKDNHAHFHCNKCDKTLCMDEINVPQIKLPNGYKQSSAYLVIKGICQKCTL